MKTIKPKLPTLILLAAACVFDLAGPALLNAVCECNSGIISIPYYRSTDTCGGTAAGPGAPCDGECSNESGPTNSYCYDGSTFQSCKPCDEPDIGMIEVNSAGCYPNEIGDCGCGTYSPAPSVEVEFVYAIGEGSCP
jgi:hypothetical protein